MGREKAGFFIKKNNLSGIIYYRDEKGNISADEINLKKYKKVNFQNGKAE